MIKLIQHDIKNAMISTTTIVAPTGVPASIDVKIPSVAHTTEITAEQMVTDLKLLNILIADMAGNITIAVI